MVRRARKPKALDGSSIPLKVRHLILTLKMFGKNDIYVIPLSEESSDGQVDQVRGFDCTDGSSINLKAFDF